MGLDRLPIGVNINSVMSSVQSSLGPGAFMAYPLVLSAAQEGLHIAWQQDLYQIAFEQAQAAARPATLFERDWLGVWN
jgi:hypothetical protein